MYVCVCVRLWLGAILTLPIEQNTSECARYRITDVWRFWWHHETGQLFYPIKASLSSSVRNNNLLQVCASCGICWRSRWVQSNRPTAISFMYTRRSSAFRVEQRTVACASRVRLPIRRARQETTSTSSALASLHHSRRRFGILDVLPSHQLHSKDDQMA